MDYLGKFFALLILCLVLKYPFRIIVFAGQFLILPGKVIGYDDKFKDNYKLQQLQLISNILCYPWSFQANGDASLGKYVAGSVAGAVGDATLFVANHAY